MTRRNDDDQQNQQPSPHFIGRAIEFRSPKEVEATRPEFDPAYVVTRANFLGVVGRCTFQAAERVLCQLDVDEKGSVCRQEHGNGWLAKTRNGPEGYIGRDCANIHLGMDDSFRAETNRVRRELRIDALVDRIRKHLADPVLRGKLEPAIERHSTLRTAIRGKRDLLPDKARTVLLNMSKSGSATVDVEFRHIDEDDEGNEISKWTPATIGTISGLECMDGVHMQGIRQRLERAQVALVEAVASNEHSETKLRSWADALDDIDRCDKELDDIESALRLFMAPENIRLLCFTVRSDDDQHALVRFAIEQSSGRRATGDEVKAVRRNWRDEVRQLDGGRDFRIP